MSVLVRPFLRTDRRRYFVAELAVGEAFEDPFPGRESVLLLYATVETPFAWRNATCDALAATRVGYVLCAGIECETWHDTIDEAVVGDGFEEGEEVPPVMTTWHDDQPEDDVAFELVHVVTTNEHDVPFETFLVLTVGPRTVASLSLVGLVRRHEGERAG